MVTYAVSKEEAIRMARELAISFASQAAHYDETGEFPHPNYLGLLQQGFLGLVIPEKYGGMEADFHTWAVCLCEIAKGCPNTALTFCMHCVVQMFISALGTEEQKLFYFSQVKRGALFASATSEPQSSFRHAFAITPFQATPRGWRVNVTKHFCSIGMNAQQFFVSGMMEGHKKASEGMISAIIPAGTPGIKLIQKWKGDSMRATSSDTIEFCVEVSEFQIVGSRGELPKSGLLNCFALGYAAVYLGVAKKAFESLLNLMQVQHDDKSVQRIIGEMDIRIETSFCLLEKAAQALIERSPDATVWVNRAKYSAAETAKWVTDHAMRLAGGRGITTSLPFAWLAREARAGIVMPPHDDRCLETVGLHCLGLEQPTLEIVSRET